MTWEHPKIGRFNPLPPGKQPLKVWKHLYAAVERWSELVDVDVSALAQTAREAGCPERPELGGTPVFPSKCQPLMKRHHDEVWVETYRSEIFSERAFVARKSVRRQWAIATPRGVYAVVNERGRGEPSDMCTVYRPHDPGSSVPPDEGHFVRQARRKWEQETNMRSDVVNAWLREPTEDATGVWLLAHAIGTARAHGDAEALLLEAEARIAAVSPELRAQATPAAGRLLNHLERVLKDEDEDEAEEVLVDLANAVLVTSVLTDQATADALIERLAALLDWSPSGWSTLAATADARQAGAGGLLARWWGEVAERLTATALAEAAPAPRATLSASLFPVAPRSMFDRLLGLLPEARPVDWFAGAAEVGAAVGEWEVRAPARLRSEHGVRVFVLDAASDVPDEVTDLLAAGGPIWSLDVPGEEVVVIVVRGGPTDPAAVLRDVLSGDLTPDEVHHFIRPR
jgi:hypothetical protein